MELFPAQPDLSLQISPPTTTRPRTVDHDSAMDLGFWSMSNTTSSGTRSSSASAATTATNIRSNLIDLSLANPTSTSSVRHSYASRPIRGIPVYHGTPHHASTYPAAFCAAQQFYGEPTMPSSVHRSRLLSRYPGRRSMRAPRMRWTATLHARFVHAVELLGGHERATPKSVLELMDVKDLTLAHVKSHLQMYRTAKTADRPPTSSGQNEPIEISDDNLLDIRGPEPMMQNGKSSGQNGNSYYGLWSNSSSRGSWFHDKQLDSTPARSLPTFENCMQSKSGETISADVLDSSCNYGEPSAKKPNLEFTLGRPR